MPSAEPRAQNDLPPGYVQARSPAATWIVSRDCARSIEKGEADFLLAGWGRRASHAGTGRGRLSLFSLAGQRVVGKRPLHGGFLGRLLGSLYLGEGRGLSQIPIAERLRRAGIPTPEILAVGSRRALGVFRTQAIVTREIAGALNLYEAASAGAAGRRIRQLLKASADLVRALHDAGFLHADLNVSNLVLGRNPEGETLHVVDLEKGRFVLRAGVRTRFEDLARLMRSYEKWIADRMRLSPREELFFLRRYCRSDRALLRDLAGRLQHYRARLRARRFAWRHLPSRRSSLLAAGRRE